MIIIILDLHVHADIQSAAYYYYNSHFYRCMIDQLGPATDLRRIFISNQESVTYIWQPPFSLNITSADPDIAYCVSIDEVTCPVNERINEVHDCNITQPYYELPNQFDTGKIYSIAITPRANIPGIELIETDNGTYSTTIHEGLNYKCHACMQKVNVMHVILTQNA